MPDTTRVHVASVKQFVVPEDAGDATLILEGADPFVVRRGQALFPVWSRIVANRRETGLPLYVEYDAPTRVVARMFLPSPRQIESVDPEPREGRLEVMLLMAPSVYFLRTERPDFEQMRQTLEEARRTGREMLVTPHPDTQEILDVRPAK